MNILFIRPISDTYIITPPLGLGYLATAVRKAGHRPVILDCVKERMDFDGFGEYVKRSDFDAVGIQVWSCDLPNVKRSLEIVKRNNRNTITIVGGAHPSGLSQEVLGQLQDADYAFKGEAEIGLPMLLEALSGRAADVMDNIPGLIRRKASGSVVNPSVFEEDLDKFGIPAWDLMPPGEYPHAPHQGFAKAFPAAPIVVTRGCPFLCTFCATHEINGRKIRSRSIDSVISEIKLLKENYGVREIHIEDDNFTFRRDVVRDFCNKMIGGNIDIYWYCSSGVRLDSLDKDTLRLMKKAKCYTLTIAIESGSQRVLDLMKKGLTIEKIRMRVGVINEAGYVPTGLFMIGFPGETNKEMEETLKFAMSLNLKRAQFAIFHPLPGSVVFNELKAKGELKDLDWTKLKPSEVACESEGATKEELKAFQRAAFLRFHLRPKILYYQVCEIQSIGHLFFLLKRVWDMISPRK